MTYNDNQTNTYKGLYGRNKTFIDLEAIEARVMASCKKPVVDPHTQRAADYYKIHPSEVTREQRAIVKQVYHLEVYRARPEDVKCLWETKDKAER